VKWWQIDFTIADMCLQITNVHSTTSYRAN
jgi:hypothetical protein